MRKRLRQAFEALLQLHDTPHRIALSFGIGVWIAFFPIWGIHTGMALGIAFLFRLSRAAMIIAAYINNPWTAAPMYLAGTIVGCYLMGVSTAGLADIDWTLSGSEFFQSLLETLRPYLWPFILGNSLLGVLGGSIGYFLLRSILERRRARLQSA